MQVCSFAPALFIAGEPSVRRQLISRTENLERVGRSRHRRCDPGRAHRLLHPRLSGMYRHVSMTSDSSTIPKFHSIG